MAHPRRSRLSAGTAANGGRTDLLIRRAGDEGGEGINAGYNGPDIWRWGGIQNNGFERTDPRFEEFAMIGADGLTLDRQGRVIVAAFAGRALVRLEPNGKRTVLADGYEGKRFNGPNDVVVKRDGGIYFTDTYGLGVNAVFLWKNGKLTLLIKDMPATNGLAFSPDEKYLYVNGSRDLLFGSAALLPFLAAPTPPAAKPALAPSQREKSNHQASPRSALPVLLVVGHLDRFQVSQDRVNVVDLETEFRHVRMARRETLGQALC